MKRQPLLFTIGTVTFTYGQPTEEERALLQSLTRREETPPAQSFIDWIWGRLRTI